MYEYLDRRYALALYEVAEERNKVKEYMEDLHFICDVIDNNRDFYEVIKHPQIGTKQKKKTFINIFKGRIDESLLSFLLILIEKDRILFIREKLNEMIKIHLDRNNTLTGIVKTTVPLTDEEFNTLISKLEKKYNKKIILEREIDPSILGGIFLKVNNEIMDGTVKLRLENLKKLMFSTE